MDSSCLNYKKAVRRRGRVIGDIVSGQQSIIDFFHCQRPNRSRFSGFPVTSPRTSPPSDEGGERASLYRQTPEFSTPPTNSTYMGKLDIRRNRPGCPAESVGKRTPPPYLTPSSDVAQVGYKIILICRRRFRFRRIWFSSSYLPWRNLRSSPPLPFAVIPLVALRFIALTVRLRFEASPSASISLPALFGRPRLRPSSHGATGSPIYSSMRF